MIKSQRRTPGRHFMQNKPIRFGIKIYMLAEAKSAYICNINLAQPDHTVPQGQKINSVVLNLATPYDNKNYHLYMDNWYTSYGLLEQLSENGWQCCGTIRANRG